MIDAYVWNTPNGFKALIGLEEFGLAYKAHWIDISKGEQMNPDFVAVNPNSKIPAIVDHQGPGSKPLAVFESGAILVYLAEKTGKLLPVSGADRYTTLEWVFFNVAGPGPMIGQLSHFKKFAPEKIPYAIERYTKETHRLCKVLDSRLGEVPYLAKEFSIADIANMTWPNTARSFLGMDLGEYKNLVRWLDDLEKRPAFVRALAMKP